VIFPASAARPWRWRRLPRYRSRVLRVAAWLAIAACGDGAIRPDAASDSGGGRPDAAVPAIDEADDCSGSPLIPRQGTPLVASRFAIVAFAEAVDLDGDGFVENRLYPLTFFVDVVPDPELASGRFAIPVEIFEHGADPDPCVKLAMYRGACASPPCDFTDGVADPVALDPASIAGGAPVSRLRAMRSEADGTLAAAGPGYLEVPVPVLDTDNVARQFPLPITVQYARGTLGPAGIDALHIAGTMQAFRLGQLAVPKHGSFGTKAGDTGLDAMFANVLGRDYLMLPRPRPDCLGADLDLDGDGLEMFCDIIDDDGVGRVDTCIDGDGTVIHDGDNGLADCSQAMKHGRPRFPDGVSSQVRLSARPGLFTP
jgi:hypothetical protein